jgi:hypothetical protein
MDSYVETCKALAVEGMEECLKALSFVPDDKLNWQPTPTAKSAIRIAAHSAIYPAKFAKMVRDRKLPSHDSVSTYVSDRNALEVTITTREEVERLFRVGTAEFVAALEGIKPEEVDMSLDSGLGWSVPMSWLMRLAGLHAMNHSAQIEYLQTCWDDQEVHF